MTATYNESVSAPTQGATGRIARVIGPVVDVEFPAGQVPEIYNALTTELTLDGRTRTIAFETAQHLGDSIVRAISLQQTDGLVRGQAVVDTGAPISVPVGDGVKGHIFNVLGDALDVPNSEIKADTYWPIHRAAPGFAELEGSTEMLETGIKIRLFGIPMELLTSRPGLTFEACRGMYRELYGPMYQKVVSLESQE